jgi:hypothetical protein
MMHKLGHTPYIEKQIVKLAIASLATSIMSSANYVCVKSQNDPTPHEHAIQGPHIVLAKILLIFVHFSTFIVRNYLPI